MGNRRGRRKTHRSDMTKLKKSVWDGGSTSGEGACMCEGWSCSLLAPQVVQEHHVISLVCCPLAGY